MSQDTTAAYQGETGVVAVDARRPPDPYGRTRPGGLEALRAALSHPEPRMRLHAIGELAQIDDPTARTALATALHDESFGIQWAAAHALALAGPAGVAAALRALTHDTPSTGFLHGVAHVLRHATLAPVERAAIAPVLDALHRPVADLEAPMLAPAALQQLEECARPAPQPDEPWWRFKRVRQLRGRMFALGS